MAMIRIIDRNFTAEGLLWKRFVQIISEGLVNNMRQMFVQALTDMHPARLLTLNAQPSGVEGCVFTDLFDY
jgi:hypothetical protein